MAHLYEAAAPQEDFFVEQQQAMSHGALEAGHHPDATRVEELARERLGNGAFVAEQAPPQLFRKLQHRAPIIDIARGGLTREQLAVVVDHHMPFEAVEPSHRCLPSFGHPAAYAVLLDAPIVTHRQRGRVHEGNARTGGKTGLQIGAERAKGGWHELDKALVGNRPWELALQMPQNVGEVLGFEVTKAELVEVNHDSHDFTHRQLAVPLAHLMAVVAELLIPQRYKRLAERIDMTEQFQ